MLQELEDILRSQQVEKIYLSMPFGIAGPFSFHFFPFDEKKAVVTIAKKYTVVSSTQDSLIEDLNAWFILASEKKKYIIEKLLYVLQFSEMPIESMIEGIKLYHPEVANPEALLSWYFTLYLRELIGKFYIVPPSLDEDYLQFSHMHKNEIFKVKEIKRR